MSWVVDPPVRAGARVFAAVCRLRGACHSSEAAVYSGEKRPVLILVFHRGAVTGAGIDGKSYSAAEIEESFPQAIARTLARLARMPQGQ
ncbi:hypothetical protein K3552_20985 (plasmid) [Leisingera aquaemixtae]|uniref:hypothetical protein n=1 Tax=Leisingera aquaemixtae TaxID=1396826 RepID=UPI0021A30C6C|nr:hypothetical protein [Leisingera aquaemixtae]UWQ39802.1 hypothetical protein K3552_20985 [Leisingera aquaemixtae]